MSFKALYKFVHSADVVHHILSGTVKFSRIADLNDPSALVPLVIREEVRKSLERLMARGYTDEDMLHLRRQGKLLQKLAPDFMRVQFPSRKEEATELIRSRFYDSMDALERLLNGTAGEMSDKGLLAISCG